MLSTAIILAGGLGTRLQTVVNDVPKPMAPVNGRPFLYWLLQYCKRQGITEVVLSIGYKGDTVLQYFGNSFEGISIAYCTEDEPLGTGGGIYKALQHTKASEVVVLNGDTFFSIDLKQLYSLHQFNHATLSLALKEMTNFDRYGVVRINEASRVVAFEEKKLVAQGNINGGIYVLNRAVFEGKNLPQKFSFEKEVLEKYLDTEKIYGFVFRDYFIDIGIPEDYSRAQQELKPFTAGNNNPLAGWKIDRTWTVFLDRDGVINKKIDDDYVRNLGMFEWLPGSLEAIKLLSKAFGKVIIVSNQQGVGKGLMTIDDVQTVHNYIANEVAKAGGRIDRIYFAPQLKEENHPHRKPGIGMALEAKKDFPAIDFSRSIMIGDSASDMEFGKNAGMKRIFINHKNNIEIDADMVVHSLADIAYFINT